MLEGNSTGFRDKWRAAMLRSSSVSWEGLDSQKLALCDVHSLTVLPSEPGRLRRVLAQSRAASRAYCVASDTVSNSGVLSDWRRSLGILKNLEMSEWS